MMCRSVSMYYSMEYGRMGSAGGPYLTPFRGVWSRCGHMGTWGLKGI